MSTARSLRTLTTLVTLMLTLGALAAGTARAQVKVDASSVENRYPQQLVFKLTATSDQQITDASLVYTLTGRGAGALGRPESVTPGKTVSVSVTVDVNRGDAFIPVGSEFVYHWEVETASGTTSTPEQRFLLLPPRMEWRTVENDFMRVYYTGAAQATAQDYLKAGDETYDRIGKRLLNTRLRQLPVKVILFPAEADLEQARKGGGGGQFDTAVHNCGVKYTNDIVHVIAESCGSRDRTDTLRHEFGHIINQTAGEGPLGKLPSWLDEGTSVYAQTDPGDGYLSAFESAVRLRRLIPFNQMTRPSNDARTVDLFYGQSYQMVKYLVDEGGPEKYAQLFKTIRDGSRFDQAMQQVYGFDVAGFQERFLAKHNTGVRDAPTQAPTARPAGSGSPTAAPTARPRVADPTATPTRRPQAAQSGAADDDGGIGTATLLMIGAAVIFLLLAALAFLGTLVLGNRNRPAGGGGPTAAA